MEHRGSKGKDLRLLARQEEIGIVSPKFNPIVNTA
jgi:hypothetical protein